MSWTYVVGGAGFTPISPHSPFALQHLARLADRLMQEMQLAKYKSCIQGITRERADVHDVQALIHEVANRHELLQNQAGGVGGLRQSQSCT